MVLWFTCMYSLNHAYGANVCQVSSATVRRKCCAEMFGAQLNSSFRF